MPGIYGPVVTLDQVEDGIETVLRAWIDTYLGEVERARGLQLRSIRRPDDTGYQFDGDVRAAPAGSFPIIQIHTPGEVTDPSVEMDSDLGERLVSGHVAFSVAAIVHAGGRRATSRLKHRYAAALAMVIDQKAGDPLTSPLPALGCQVITPVVQVPADIHAPAEGQDRWLGVAQIGFLVLVSGMRQLSGGPAAPDNPAVPLPSSSPTDPLHVSTNVTVTGHMP